MDSTHPIRGVGHSRFHRIIERGDPPACRYCDVPLVCSCTAPLSADGAQSAPPGAEFFTTDHVIPRSLGGSDRLDNLVLACVACNSRKGARAA